VDTGLGGRQVPPGGREEGPLAELAAGAGTDWATFTREQPGMSAFALEEGVVYHTFSAYAQPRSRPVEPSPSRLVRATTQHTIPLQRRTACVGRVSGPPRPSFWWWG